MFKALVRVFTSVNKKISEVASSKPRFASSQVSLKNKARLHELARTLSFFFEAFCFLLIVVSVTG